MLRTIALIVSFVVSVASLSSIQAADKRPGAFVVTPKEGAFVGRTSEITGKTFLRGQPLALVRAVGGKGHWWVQRTIQRNDRGQLRGTLQFGNELAEPGTRFALVIVVVQTPLELELFTKRESLAELPTSVPKSAIRYVVFGAPGDGRAGDKRGDDKPNQGRGEKPTKPRSDNDPAPPKKGPPDAKEKAPNKVTEPAAEPSADLDKMPPAGDKGKPTKLGLAILKPLENAMVQRLEELVGRMESEDTPIVLVRPEGAEGQWWVQDKVVFGEGKYFKTKLRFGNDTTPVGTRFMVLLVSPKPGPEANALKPGMAFAELPRGMRRSKQVIVRLGPPLSPEGAK